MDTKSTEEERDTYPIEYAMYSKVYMSRCHCLCKKERLVTWSRNEMVCIT